MSGVHLSQGETSIHRVVQAVRYQQQGRDDACGTVTLVTNTSSTTVQAPNCAETSAVFLEAMTAAAAVERTTGNLFVSSVGNATFVIAHTNTSAAGRTFFWTARG